MKNALFSLMKITVAVVLISYLVHKGQLDFSQLGKFVSTPSLALATFGYWLFGPTLLGSIRWRLLLQGIGYKISWLRAIRLQLTGFFFNTAMPGAVGGDLVKVLYVIRDNKHMGKSPAIMSIFLDRLIGLSGLFIVGLIAALLNFNLVKSEPILVSLVGTLALVVTGTILFFFAALYNYKSKDPFAKILSRNYIGFPQLLKLYDALRSYRHERIVIVKCFVLSMGIQLFALSLFVFIANTIIPDESPAFGMIATVFPIGMFTIALPIAPGGLGVGHVAFDELFAMIGLSQGASIFNVFLLSQMALNMLGAIPYISLKKQEPVGDLNSALNS